MATSLSYECLSCRLKSLVVSAPRNTRRQFHASIPRSARRRPAFPSVKQNDLEVLEAREKQIDKLSESFKPYTAREKEVLAMRYTPEQMEIIEAGEKAVSARDMVEQGRLRNDAFRPTYIDDFSTLRPVLDDASPGTSANSPKRGGVKAPGSVTANSTTAEEADPHMLKLSQQTGMPIQDIKRIRFKNLVQHRVVNQTKMGKIQSLYYLTVAGNEKGMVGIGEGKAVEHDNGARQAMMNAIRNMKPIPRYEERTIYGDVTAKVGASIVQLSARPPGFGNRAQYLIYEIARAAGISDIAARTPRSRNKMNVCKAAFKALTNQRLPEDVARARGRKLVDSYERRCCEKKNRGRGNGNRVRGRRHCRKDTDGWRHNGVDSITLALIDTSLETLKVACYHSKHI
nr:putative 37s ribosomal protein s5, mitochondrial [Quercus suber]